MEGRGLRLSSFAPAKAGVSTLALSLLIACGGTVTSPDAGRPTDAAREATALDGGTAGCPAAAPASGASCTSPTLSCEYGSDPQITCNMVMTCDGSSWTKSQTPATTGCGTTNEAACPATYADVAAEAGATCATAVSCDYPEARCACALNDCQGACFLNDAALVPLTWSCDVPADTTGCPIPRPRLGAACTVDPLVCDYGGCEGNVTFQCQGTTWLAIATDCPR